MKNAKILFVCSANVGRSQMAEAFFNALAGSDLASSAGASARLKKYEGRTIGEAGPKVTKAMRELGFDVSARESKQLTREAAESANIIVFMTSLDEMPDYLRNNPKMRIWEIKDPADEDFDSTLRIAKQIRSLVETLAAEIGDIETERE